VDEPFLAAHCPRACTTADEAGIALVGGDTTAGAA
jgi:hypothetical protein